jgi:hypothetical protein
MLMIPVGKSINKLRLDIDRPSRFTSSGLTYPKLTFLNAEQ